jgi:hypothetical protein
MKNIFIPVVIALACCIALAERPKIVVETPALDDSTQKPSTFEYVAPTDSTPGRLVIDASEMIYQMKVDSINKSAEDKIREQIKKLERKFEDPKVEEQVGVMIGNIVLEQQLALVDLQVDRAFSLRDTLLIWGLKAGLEELLKQHPELEYELVRMMDRIEQQFPMPKEQ